MSKIIKNIVYDEKLGCFNFEFEEINKKDNFLISYESYLKFNIHKDEKISDELFEKIAIEDQRNRAWIYAERYALFCPRSIGQVRKKLMEKGFETELISEIINKLKDRDLVDDYDFACRYCIDKAQINKWSKRKIDSKLFELGINRETADLALSQIDDSLELDAIENILTKKYSKRDLSDRKEFSRTYQAMIRRGFPGKLILEIMRKKAEEQANNGFENERL